MRTSKPGDEAADCALSEFDKLIREKVLEALADPRPLIPAEKVFADLRARHANVPMLH